MRSLSSDSQEQTKDTFGFKWNKSDSYASPTMQKEWQRWLFEKYFDDDESALNKLLNSGAARKRILDAGCGSAQSAILLFGNHIKNHDYLGVDISEAVALAEEKFIEKGLSGTFLKCDVNKIPESYGDFDIIFSTFAMYSSLLLVVLTMIP